MSDPERPDIHAFHELEQLIRALGDEMAGWRRRAQQAEAKLKEVAPAPARGEGRGGREAGGSPLERENAALRARLEAARRRTRTLLDRMRFLRQQHGLGVEK
ncbi:MAG: hypothetical protein M3068_03600 [Gemmatimonadota bacterium]|nr:hypothetical protein [Gemmatimonadota bacterium]